MRGLKGLQSGFDFRDHIRKAKESAKRSAKQAVKRKAYEIPSTSEAPDSSNLQKGCQRPVVKGAQKLRNVDKRYKKADGLVPRSVNLLATIGITSQRENKGEQEQENDGYLDGSWVAISGFKTSPESSTEPVHRSTH